MSTVTGPVLGLLAAAVAVTAGACATAPSAAPPPSSAPELRRAETTAGGVRLEYWVRAPATETARPVLLVPGLTGAADGWLAYPDLVDPLVARGHRVIALSVRGRGGSATPETGWTLEDHARDVAAVVAAEGLGKIHVIAHAAGAAYALRWALDAPAAVDVFVAVDQVPGLARVDEGWAAGVGGNVDGRQRYDRTIARRILEAQGPAVGELGDQALVRDLRPELAKATFSLLVLLDTRGRSPAQLGLVETAWAGAPAAKVVRVEAGPDLLRDPAAVQAVLQALDPPQ